MSVEEKMVIELKHGQLDLAYEDFKDLEVNTGMGIDEFMEMTKQYYL